MGDDQRARWERRYRRVLSRLGRPWAEAAAGLPADAELVCAETARGLHRKDIHLTFWSAGWDAVPAGEPVPYLHGEG